MVSHEFEGKTTEEAIQNASRELNVPAEELDIEIIEPGSAGIFGLVGSKKARIKVIIDTDEDETEALPEEAPAETPAEIQAEISSPLDSDIPTEPEKHPVDANDLAAAKEVLENILALIPVETTVSAEQKNGNINLNILGDKSGLLIGRKGKTLDALQFILNRAINKKSETRSRIIVDSENYRERRKESLAQTALKMGEKAKRIKKPVTTHLLNAHDRRIFHVTLKDDNQLEVRSRGDGLLKKIVIIPKK
jgi:spoIIIJ-associated protein